MEWGKGGGGGRLWVGGKHCLWCSSFVVVLPCVPSLLTFSATWHVQAEALEWMHERETLALEGARALASMRPSTLKLSEPVFHKPFSEVWPWEAMMV